MVTKVQWLCWSRVSITIEQGDQRIGYILDNESLRWYASSIVAGKLCDEHRYSYEWINGQKPHLVKKRYLDTMQHRELRSDRGSWFVNEFFFQVASTTAMTPSRQEIDHPTSSSSSSTSPSMTSSTVSTESVGRQVRGDFHGMDSCPVISCPVIVLSKRWEAWTRRPVDQATQNPKPNKNEDHDLERGDLLKSDVPEWLQEFRENLVDDRVPEHRDSHASSSHEPF